MFIYRYPFIQIRHEQEMADSIVNKAIELWLQKDTHKL